MFTSSSKNFLLSNNSKIDTNDLSKSFYFYNNKDLLNIVSDIEDPYKRGEFRIFQEISYKCTGQCSYCMNKGLDYAIKESPVEDFIDFYQKIINNGGSIRLKITGGEPLQPNVRERTIKLVNFALNNIEHFSLIWINSNGNWPIPIEWANQPKLIIQFSLDGPAEYVEKETKIQNLYKNLINNFNYCINNNINFRIRSVITKENEQYIPFLKEIAHKYKKLVNLNWALPVGGMKNSYDIDEYISIINKVMDFRKTNGEDPYFDARLIIGKCPKIHSEKYFRLLINPDGKLGLCPLLNTVYNIKDKTIYNLDFNELFELKNQIIKEVSDKTCGFPNGFLNFWNQLNYEQKYKLKDYINENFEENFPTLKIAYNLEN